MTKNKKTPLKPRLLNRNQLAGYINVSPSKLSRMQREKLLPQGVLVAGKSRRWDILIIDQWINEGCQNPKL